MSFRLLQPERKRLMPVPMRFVSYGRSFAEIVYENATGLRVATLVRHTSRHLATHRFRDYAVQLRKDLGAYRDESGKIVVQELNMEVQCPSIKTCTE